MREDAGAYELTLDLSSLSVTEADLTVEMLGPELTIGFCVLGVVPGEDARLQRRELVEESFRLPDDANLDALRAHLEPQSLVIDAPRRRLERRVLPIGRSRFAINPEAEAV